MSTNEIIKSFSAPVLAGVVIIVVVIGIGLIQTSGNNDAIIKTAERTTNITLIAPQAQETTAADIKLSNNEDTSFNYSSDKKLEVKVSAVSGETLSAEEDDDSEDSGDD